jgi:hypothetical protein
METVAKDNTGPISNRAILWSKIQFLILVLNVSRKSKAN